MQRYNINNRLAYLSGGVQSAGGMWPSVAAGDWWDVAGETCVAAYQAKGAASQAASYSNLANPGTYDLTATSAPTWDTSTGWTFSGTQRLSLTTNLSTFLTSAATYIIRMNITGSGGGTAGRAIESQDASNNYVYLIPNNGVATVHSYQNGGLSSPLAISGVLTGARVMAMAAATAYLDGSAETGTVGNGTQPVASLIIGNRGSGDRALGGSIQAFAIYSTTLDASQISSLTTAMNAL